MVTGIHVAQTRLRRPGAQRASVYIFQPPRVLEPTGGADKHPVTGLCEPPSTEIPSVATVGEARPRCRTPFVLSKV